MKSSADITPLKWTAPQCPFAIEYAPRVVDDMRLAVVDAFFSLPRGGVEIGGILLGGVSKDRLTIVDSVPLECEHAFGPSFMLSPNDLANLEKQLAGLPSGGSIRPVGWYHSHTRSGIFLSDADLEIHRRFFPEPWQVALVLRPHSFEPVRAGFFFREADGSVHASVTYQEFALDPLPVQPIPAHPRAAPPTPAPTTDPQPPIAPEGPVLETPTLREIPVAHVPQPAPPAPAWDPELGLEPEPLSHIPEQTAAGVEPPRFLAEPGPSSKRWLAMVWILAGVGIGVAGFKTRDWWPKAVGLAQKASPRPPGPSMSLGLTTTDAAGQLQIRWDRNAAGILSGTGALLMIVDGGGPPQARGLDAALLQSGAFTYARQSGQVDVTLTVHQPAGEDLQESAAFLGAAPPAPGRPEDPSVRKKQQELQQRAVRLQADLNKQAARTRKLEKNLEDMRIEMQKKRMDAQVPDQEKQ